MEDDGYILSARSGLATPSVGEIFALALALAAYARIEGPAQLWLAGHGGRD